MTILKSDGTKFFFFLLFFQILFSELLFLLRNHFDTALLRNPAVIVLIQVITFLVPLAIWLAIKKQRLIQHMPNMKLGRTNTFMVLGLSVFMLPMMSFLSALTSMITDNVATGFLEQTQQYSIWALLLAVAVTPAIVEEVVFRGYIQQQYKEWPFWSVAVLNGFLFGLIHFSFQQFFYAFFMGIVFAYIVHITRSIRAGILSHFFMNAVNILMFRWATGALASMEEAEAAAEVSPAGAVLTVGIVALIFLPFLIVLFRAFLSHNRQRFAEYDIEQNLKEETSTDQSAL